MSESAMTLPNACVPYVLQPGEGPGYVVAGQLVRMLATSTETAGAFGIVVCTSGQDRMAVPLHWHEREHDTWFCTQGRLQVWNGRESRMLYPGDFAYVAPRDTHSYMCRGQFTSFFGVVGPGGWEEFFVDAGSPFSGAIFPAPGTVPIDFPRLGAAMAKHGVNRVQDQTYAPATASDQDTMLPGQSESYFLEAGHGDRCTIDGRHVTTLLSAAETNGIFSMQVVQSLQGDGMMHTDNDTLEVIYILGGTLRIVLGETEHYLPVGGMANIPAGTAKSISVVSPYARWVSTTSGGAAVRRCKQDGAPTELFAPVP